MPTSAQGQMNLKHVMLTSLTTWGAKELPDHDLYVAGFPCQPFSTMGPREGIADAPPLPIAVWRVHCTAELPQPLEHPH